MKLPFKKKVGRVVLISLAGFLVLFLFRFVYGYTTGASEVGEEYISDFFSEREDLKHNYASDKYRYKTVSLDEAVSSAPAAQTSTPPHGNLMLIRNMKRPRPLNRVLAPSKKTRKICVRK